MSTTILERQYHCWNDCSQSGCPGHIATLSFQSTSDSLYFSNGKGSDIYMQPPELEAFLAMLHELAETRMEISSVLDQVFMRSR